MPRDGSTSELYCGGSKPELPTPVPAYAAAPAPPLGAGANKLLPPAAPRTLGDSCSCCRCCCSEGGRSGGAIAPSWAPNAMSVLSPMPPCLPVGESHSGRCGSGLEEQLQPAAPARPGYGLL